MKQNHLSLRLSGSPLRGLALCVLLSASAFACASVLGCARETAPGTTPATEPASNAGLEGQDDESARGEVATDPAGDAESASSVQAEAPAGSAAADPVAEAPAAEPPPADVPVVVDMTPAAAPTICASLHYEPETVRRCAFKRGGITLPNGARADLLELEYDTVEAGPVVAAYLVVRIPIDGYPTTQLLGESSEVPGMSTIYSLGRLERTSNGVRIRVTRTETTYPNTGDPDEPTGAEVDRARLVVTCSLDAETNYYDCEQS